MKTFIATVAAAVALTAAPAAHAAPFTPDELDYLRDLESVGIINTGGDVANVNYGWMICGVLYQGYPRNWVAQQLYVGSQETNGAAGLSWSGAQALVFYANADLCPGVGS